MQQQTFPIVSRKPDVEITHVTGNLNVRSWEREEIQVSVNGEAGTMRQDGNTLKIADCQGDLELTVPAIWKFAFPIATGISATGVSQNVSIEDVRKVNIQNVGSRLVIKNVGGNAEVEQIGELTEIDNVGGNLRAAHMPVLRTHNIGGNATLFDAQHIDLHAVGGNLGITRAAEFLCGAVGGNLDVDGVEEKMRCGSVGGNCEVRRSSAEIEIATVGGNFVSDEGARTKSCVVGGNLRAYLGDVTDGRFHVGGQATLSLPEHANVTVRAITCGNVNGSGVVYSRGAGIVNLMYGEGMGHVTVTAGGNITILGGGEPRTSGFTIDDMGRHMADVGREMSRVGKEVAREMSRVGREMSRDLEREMRRSWKH